MSTPNTPLLGPFLAVMGQQHLIDRAQGMFDWATLQKFLGQNIPTVGIDAVASGADPTGQKDSWSALQNVLQSTGTLFLRPGVYKLSAPLTFVGSCLIWCESQATFAMTAGSNCSAIDITDAETVFIRGINFIGQTGNLSAVKVTNSLIGTSKFALISACVFNNWTTGIHLSKFTPSFIVDNWLLNNVTDINLNLSPNSIIDSNWFGAVGGAVLTGSNQYQTRNNIGLDDFSNAWLTPRAQAYQAAGQVVATGTPTALVFDTAVYTQRAVWTGPTSSQFTAAIPGVYTAKAQSGFTVPVAGQQLLQVRVNGAVTTPAYSSLIIVGAVVMTQQVVADLNLIAGDYVEFWVTHLAGINLTTIAGQTWGSLDRATP